METLLHHLFSVNWNDFLIPGINVLEKIKKTVIPVFITSIGFYASDKLHYIS